uniref:Uncharacterized protein n=1 Tax=Triticum urartu TaxID=4572 RepID=A0A8R7U319_TRIUA
MRRRVLHRRHPDPAGLRSRRRDLRPQPHRGLFPRRCAARPPRRRPAPSPSHPHGRRSPAGRRCCRGRRGGETQGGKNGVRREAGGVRRRGEAQDYQGAEGDHEFGPEGGQGARGEGAGRAQGRGSQGGGGEHRREDAGTGRQDCSRVRGRDLWPGCLVICCSTSFGH